MSRQMDFSLPPPPKRRALIVSSNTISSMRDFFSIDVRIIEINKVRHH